MNLQTRSIVRNVDVDGPRSITSYNPATEEEIATVSALDSEGAVDAVGAAKEAFPGWAATPVAERQKIIARWLEIMLDERDELAKLVSMEGGKPVNEARLVDVFPGLETLSFYSKKLARLLAFKPVKPYQLLFAHWKAGYRFDPLGVMAIITPWNYPVGIPMAEIVPAVGAGNTVVFKPASATVLTGLMLGDMARRAGFPLGVVNTVALPGSATDVVLDHPDVAKVLFTGSVEIGRHVARRCAERLVPAQLELGGKDAAVVAADAHLERTARGVVWGAFVNTGQTWNASLSNARSTIGCCRGLSSSRTTSRLETRASRTPTWAHLRPRVSSTSLLARSKRRWRQGLGLSQAASVRVVPVFSTRRLFW
jgi:succinate-semialdehyde dehydrogenase/glutarate-semialdehyde dehydrogenase